MLSSILRFGPLLIVVIVAGSMLWRFFRNYQGSETRLSQDVSHRNLPVPAWALGAAGQLLSLGFVRLGETETRLPARPKISVIWHFSNADKTVTVELMGQQETGILLNFFSVFPDESVVETGYPFGENIRDQRFRSHRIATSLEDAYQHQLAQIAAWQPEHGAPQRIRDMADLLRWEGIYRANYGRRKLITWFTRVSPSLLMVVLAAGLGTLLLVSNRQDPRLWLIPPVLLAIAGFLMRRWQ